MRNLEECRAEIFRLGEEKIKQRRKKRSRIIAACIPVCLCVVACAGLHITGRFPFVGPDIPMYADVATDKFVELEIRSGAQGDTFYKRVTDVDDVSCMLDTVVDCYNKGGTFNFSVSEDVDKGHNNGVLCDTPPSLSDVPDQAVRYSITFKTADGREATYILSEYDTLYTNNGGSRYLDNELMTRLMNAFELY